MIPLQLALKNFLCYRGGEGPILDLEGIRLACLCGPNGHGKSALLDAITWALWGRARGKSQDELIYYGADEMRVELEFEARQARYRVARRHARGGSRSRRPGDSDLQLQLFDGSTFVPITGNVMRETQARIEQLIGMDYDTFINSAFLLQGRADEFANRTPGERKEVLAKIMGLEEYDDLQKRARERVADRRAAANVIEGGLEQMQREVSRRDEVEAGLLALQGELAQVDLRVQGERREVEALNAQVDALRRRRAELEELEGRIPLIEEELSHLGQQVEAHQGRISEFQALLQNGEATEAGLEELRGVRHQYEALNRAREQFDQLAERKSLLESQIEGQKGRLEERVSQLKRSIERELGPRARAAEELERGVEEGHRHLEELAAEEAEIGQAKARLQELASAIGQHEERGERLTEEGKQTRSKLELLERSGEEARCPLCDTLLGPEACRHLSGSYRAEIERQRGLYRENQAALQGMLGESRALEVELARREANLRRGRQEAQGRLAAREMELADARKAQVELADAGEELARTEGELTEGRFAQEQRGELAQVGAAIDSLGYHRHVHDGLYRQMQQLQHFEEEHRRLLDARESLPAQQDALGRAREMLQRRRQELERARLNREEIGTETSQLPEWEERLRAASSSLADVEERQRELVGQRGRLEASLRRIEELEAQTAQDQRRLASLREEQGAYEELAAAFGRQGVQAMLIETLLPRLEEEANVLLGRMTDHRMHLKLEAQRERRNRQGVPIETLDIKINDELGPRSYEMYSGGEAFRINLALRIALSKVLANRRGAPLPTLFIDEGFGTQDAVGRERILDVIGAIEQDFQKIIVVTHLEELKEAFPVRIQVEKEDDTGARVWLS